MKPIVGFSIRPQYSGFLGFWRAHESRTLYISAPRFYIHIKAFVRIIHEFSYAHPFREPAGKHCGEFLRRSDDGSCFSRHTDIRCKHRLACRERFDDDHSISFVARGNHNQVGKCVIRQCVLFSFEENLRLDTELRSESFEISSFTAVPKNNETRILRSRTSKTAECEFNVLLGFKACNNKDFLLEPHECIPKGSSARCA